MASHDSKILIPNGTYTSAQLSASQFNGNYKGAHIIINVTNIAATSGQLTPSIIGNCISSNYTLLVGSPIITTGITVLKIYPGILPIANGAANDVLPQRWYISFDVYDSTAITYFSEVNLLV